MAPVSYTHLYTEPKGEHIILIEGVELKEEKIEFSTLEEHYNFYETQGLTKNEIIKKIAKDKNVSKNEIYQYFIKNK